MTMEAVEARAVSRVGMPRLEPGPPHERPFTWANVVTAVRVILGVALFVVAARRHSMAFNLAGLAVYWSLDVLDGWLARHLDEETRLGAQLDILGDRLLVTFFYLNHLAQHPDRALPIALYLVHFVCIDQYLSNQFIAWRLLTPNHFDRVDARVWRLNFSPLGKALNTGLVTVALLVQSSPWPPVVITLALMGVKLHSCALLWRRAAPPKMKDVEVIQWTA
jgi:CDP-diacylglycerol---glycerol-3-phosphate 3-phosphatidyltransferase